MTVVTDRQDIAADQAVDERTFACLELAQDRNIDGGGLRQEILASPYLAAQGGDAELAANLPDKINDLPAGRPQRVLGRKAYRLFHGSSS